MLALAWRNVFRNTRRSVLTASAIAFAVALMMFSASMKGGQYTTMVRNATEMLTGDAQVQAPGYRDDPNTRLVVHGAAGASRDIARLPGVTNVRARAEAFALVSVNDYGFGAQVMGVDPAAERAYATLPAMVVQGRYLGARDAEEAVVGVALARNLGARVGSELVVLGTGREGSVAALSVKIVGLLDTGILELDRALVQVPLDVFRPAFEFGDEASVLVVRTPAPDDAVRLAPRMAAALRAHDAKADVLPWPRLMPEMVQTIELSRTGNQLIYSLIGLMVVFSIANTFVMTVFERTREFGMLLSLGMRPGQLQRLLQLEAFLLCGGGVLLGAMIGAAFVGLLMRVGIPMPESAAGMMRRYHMSARMYPQFDFAMVVGPALAMLLGTQLAAFLPTLRIRRLQPVAALRGD